MGFISATKIVPLSQRLHPEIGASIFGLRWTVRVHGKGENNQRRTGKIGQNANNACRWARIVGLHEFYWHLCKSFDQKNNPSNFVHERFWFLCQTVETHLKSNDLSELLAVI